MRRREFIALVGAAAAPVLLAQAQQTAPMRSIGILTGLSETDQNMTRYLQELRRTLDGLGWIDGQTIRFEYRFAGGDADRALTLARELVDLRPDLLIAHTTPATVALRQATSTIPIVFVSITDPVAGGFVASLAHPGGNSTGFTNYDYSMGTKWLEILKDLVPDVSRVSVMLDPETGAYYAEYLQAIESVAASRGVRASLATVHKPEEMEDVIALARAPGGGLIILPSVSITAHSRLIIDAAARDRVPAIYPFGDYARNGGLVAYGVELLDLFHRAAAYADRILKGEKPGDLPVQAPTKFELVLNLKTAQALGLSVSPSLLARADEVME
jgi:putative ABC transport system substrate-binding protein